MADNVAGFTVRNVNAMFCTSTITTISKGEKVNTSSNNYWNNTNVTTQEIVEDVLWQRMDPWVTPTSNLRTDMFDDTAVMKTVVNVFIVKCGILITYNIYLEIGQRKNKTDLRLHKSLPKIKCLVFLRHGACMYPQVHQNPHEVCPQNFCCAVSQRTVIHLAEVERSDNKNINVTINVNVNLNVKININVNVNINIWMLRGVMKWLGNIVAKTLKFGTNLVKIRVKVFSLWTRCIGEIVSWWAAQRAANVSRRSLTISQINISHQLTATSLPTVPEKVCSSVHPSSVCISLCLVLPRLLAHRQVLANMAYEYATVIVFTCTCTWG